MIKAFPSARWDPTRKAWTLALALVDDYADAMRAAGQDVRITHRDGTPWSSGRAQHGRRGTPAPTWATALLDAVGPQRSEQVFKALVAILHPDRDSGDHTLMQQLNAARDQARAIR